jgi:short-subunit dehydrogenase
VALLARRKERLDALVEDLGGSGRALALACDVTRDGDPERAVARTVEEWGELDVLVANAGFAVAGNFERLTLEDHRRQLETNLFGVLRTVKAGLDELKRSRGRLAVVGSVNGYIGTPATSSYCMSKFALRGFCQSLGYELAKSGVSVTHIAPGFIASEIRAKDNQGVYHRDAADPVPPWLVASAESAAKEIVQAVAARKRERVVTFHGKVFVFIQRHFPWFVDLLAGNFDAEKRHDGTKGNP